MKPQAIGIAKQTMSWEDLLELRERILAQQEELKAHLKVVKEEMVLRIVKGKTNGIVVGNKNISIKTIYSTDEETAKLLGAITKYTVERVSTGIIKELYFKGVTIPNLVITKSPNITEIKKENE